MTENSKGQVTELRVAAQANVNSVAAAIAGSLEDGAAAVCLHCIGPRAVNQAVKAAAVAQSMMRMDGHENAVVSMHPRFERKELQGQDVTGMVLEVSWTGGL